MNHKKNEWSVGYPLGQIFRSVGLDFGGGAYFICVALNLIVTPILTSFFPPLFYLVNTLCTCY